MKHEHISKLTGIIFYTILYLCLSTSCCALFHGGDRSGYSDNYQVRLVSNVKPSEPNDNEGLVEVFINGAWGGICDDHVGDYEADAICHSLGYEKATAVLHAASGQFDAWPNRVFLKNLDCTDECYDYSLFKYGPCFFLEDCLYDSLEDESCSRDSLLGVKCLISDSGDGFALPKYMIIVFVLLFFFSVTYHGARAYQRRMYALRTGNTTVRGGSAIIMSAQHSSYPSSYPGQRTPDFVHDEPRNIFSLSPSCPPPPVGSYPTQVYHTQSVQIPCGTSRGTDDTDHGSPTYHTHEQNMPGTFAQLAYDNGNKPAHDPSLPPYLAVASMGAENVDDLPPPPSYDECVAPGESHQEKNN